MKFALLLLMTLSASVFAQTKPATGCPELRGIYSCTYFGRSGPLQIAQINDASNGYEVYRIDNGAEKTDYFTNGITLRIRNSEVDFSARCVKGELQTMVIKPVLFKGSPERVRTENTWRKEKNGNLTVTILTKMAGQEGPNPVLLPESKMDCRPDKVAKPVWGQF